MSCHPLSCCSYSSASPHPFHPSCVQPKKWQNSALENTMLLDVSPVQQQHLQKCIDKKFSWKVDEYQLLLVRTCSPASCRAGVGGGMWPRVVKLRITLRTHSPVCMITNKFCSPRPLHHVPPCTGSNSRNAFQHEGMWLVAKRSKIAT